MLSWESGKVKEFEKWPGFHADAENSTCFEVKKKEVEVVPEMVKKAIRENLPVYEYLSQFCFSRAGN
jgi:hypothetical protein